MSQKIHFYFGGYSLFGSLLMFGVGLGIYFIAAIYFQLAFLPSTIIATVAAIAFGVAFNAIAHARGTKKIHWLDFVFSFLPWDF
jgi:hypothetical protein